MSRYQVRFSRFYRSLFIANHEKQYFHRCIQITDDKFLSKDLKTCERVPCREEKKTTPTWKGKESIKQAIRKRSQLLKLSAAEFLNTFDNTTRVFSTYYLGEGPGTEKDSVLNLRANYSGKTARFIRQIKEVKLLVQSQNRAEMRDLPPRIYNLHIYVNRLCVNYLILLSIVFLNV